MGLKNARALFQRMIENTLQQFLWQFCLAYQDDVNLGTATAKQHVTAVDGVLQTLLAKGLRLKISKCKFGRTLIEMLGFRVSYHSIQPSDDHVQHLAAFPTPRCGQSPLRFLGVVSFFGRWIEQCADQTVSLYDVLRGTSWNRKKRNRAPVHVPDFEIRGLSANRTPLRTCARLFLMR
jgi:putative transposase